jgi:hypothetical protein
MKPSHILVDRLMANAARLYDGAVRLLIIVTLGGMFES